MKIFRGIKNLKNILGGLKSNVDIFKTIIYLFNPPIKRYSFPSLFQFIFPQIKFILSTVNKVLVIRGSIPGISYAITQIYKELGVNLFSNNLIL
jgi:hypothetical protein